MPEAAVHWFRKGLRLHDNPALLAAAKFAAQSGGALYPVFVLDPWFLQPERVGANRIQFLLQCLTDLHTSLQRHNSRLFVLRGKPEHELPQFFDMEMEPGMDTGLELALARGLEGCELGSGAPSSMSSAYASENESSGADY